MPAPVILADLAAIFAVALVVVLLLDRLRLPTIAGFIVAGALIGPSGFGLVADPHEIEELAEIGVALLLFTIGLEFSLEELRRLGRVLAVGGSLQVGLTVLAVAALAHAAGIAPGRAFFFGFLVALSSTVIVLRGLAERGETDAPHGRLILGVLLFQDLCVVPMLVLLPFLAGQGDLAGLPLALGKAALVVAGTLLLASRVVPRLLGLVAQTRRRDLFVLAVVVIGAGVGWLTTLAGLSLALGAFLAGVVLASSEYGHQALSDVIPLRDVFASLFFLSVGMLLDVRALAERPFVLLAGLAALVVGKAAIAALAGLAMRFPLRVAVLAGLGLAQMGEFAFVLLSVGRELGLLSGGESRLVIAASVLSMLVTPFALRFGPQLAAGAARLRAVDRLLGLREEALQHAPASLSGHVVVLGYGVGGEMLAEVLRSGGVPYAVVDINVERVRRARERGEPLYFGDVTSAEILERVRVPHARQVAVLLNDPDATLRAVRVARSLAPQALVYARARYVADVPRLIQAGASEAVAQEFEASLEVIGRVARQALAASPDRAALRAQLGSRSGEAQLAGRLPQGLDVASVAVREQAWIAGRSLAEARLRTRTGATLVAVNRGEATAVHPAPEDRLEAGDVLCLVGDLPQLAAARALIEHGPAV